MASGVRDFNVTLASRLALLAIGLGTQSCLAWVLGPSGRGAYAMCLVFASILSLVFMIGSDVACIYYVASKRFSLSQGVVQTFVSGGIGSVLAVGAGVLVLQLPLEFVTKAGRESLYLALVSIPIGFWGGTLFNLLVALQEFVSYAIVATLASLVQLALILGLVWGLDWGVNGALLATIAQNVLTMGMLLVLFRRRHGLQWVKPTVSGLWETFHYGIRYYLGKISNEVNFQMGTMILSMTAPRDLIGLFDMAAQLTARAMTLPDVLATIMVPRVAGDPQGRPALVAQCARVVAVVCGAMLLVLVIFATPIVRILFSPAFLPSVPLIRILAAGVFIRCAAKIFATYLTCTDRPGLASAATASGMVVNVALLLALMPVIGLAGAAVAMVGNYVVSSAILTIGFQRISGLGVRATWAPRWSDWAPLAAVWRRVRGRAAPVAADRP